jgi:hypothetical protein
LESISDVHYALVFLLVVTSTSTTDSAKLRFLLFEDSAADDPDFVRFHESNGLAFFRSRVVTFGATSAALLSSPASFLVLDLNPRRVEGGETKCFASTVLTGVDGEGSIFGSSISVTASSSFSASRVRFCSSVWKRRVGLTDFRVSVLNGLTIELPSGLRCRRPRSSVSISSSSSSSSVNFRKTFLPRLGHDQ